MFVKFSFIYLIPKWEKLTKAGSDNLPMVDTMMINDFFENNSNFVSAEVRNVKTKR